nr:immunoglobulin light chain junction region [Macaca mulatta]MOW33848.1 immunoglobulin light chain junction region [Macaca mulatta]MOW33852.1 immunoglobulin light chain junction region [Macaca mulatta]MOW34086.1 immunoglobulin light chain junction region [Macaca mulatta]MOW34262.1 immunoglobulin light chain junction region [Macaca mulatta]
CHQYDNFPLTF